MTCTKYPHIPDEDLVHRWVYSKAWRKKNGTIAKGAFADVEMSVDWSRFATAAQTQTTAVAQKNFQPGEIAVASFNVSDLRAIPALEVLHDPDDVTGNCAHSLVTGQKDEEVQVKLARLANSPPNPRIPWA